MELTFVIEIQFPRNVFSSTFFIVFGSLFLCAAFLLSLYLTPGKNSYSSPVPHLAKRSIPVTIEIPSLLSKIPIVPGKITNGQWELATNSALFLISSSSLEQPGNTVIYGHDTNNIFGPLHDAVRGQKIIVTTSTKQTFTYTIQDIKTVSPTDISILKPSTHFLLTVYTCNGLFDITRLVITAIRNT